MDLQSRSPILRQPNPHKNTENREQNKQSKSTDIIMPSMRKKQTQNLDMLRIYTQRCIRALEYYEKIPALL